jgi:hypothetical protein
MNAERESLLKIAEKRGITINKFWSTKKLAEVVNAAISYQEKRSDAMRRSWLSRRAIHGPNGITAESLLRRHVKHESTPLFN